MLPESLKGAAIYNMSNYAMISPFVTRTLEQIISIVSVPYRQLVRNVKTPWKLTQGMSISSKITTFLFYNKKRLGHITTFMKPFVTRSPEQITSIVCVPFGQSTPMWAFFLLFASCWLQSPPVRLVNRCIGLHLFSTIYKGS